ncbi:MAG: PilZ domain-containing protein [Acidimicrobiales bacterium]
MAASFGFDDAQLRRSTPRQFTAWRGRYLWQGEPAHHWRECQIIDVSTIGAGLLVPGATPVQVRDRRLTLNLCLPAKVTNAVDTEAGLRVGIEFLEVSPEEREELRKMAQFGVRW